MTTLREARDQGKLKEFIAEREQNILGDKDAFNRALSSMAQTSKAVPAVSKPRRSAD